MRIRFAIWTLPVLAVALARAQNAFDPEKVSDEQARKHWEYLTESERDDCVAQFEAQIAYQGTFQLALITYARSLEERDTSFLSDATEIPFFDPATHAPAQPIARTRLDPDSAAAKKELARIFKGVTPRKLRVAWRYDWGRREVVRELDSGARERTFENALAGFAPGHDLALALVERALDDGSQQKTLAAFAHAYTDRAGTVFPGITLYDAWSSGQELEMPDVDVLGVVHEVLGEWKRWIAPVPEPQHRALYDTVGELFHPAQRHRGLRQAIAWTYLEGSAILHGPYPVCIERFHGLWEASASTPSELAKILPSPAGWNDFLASADANLDRTAGLRAAAQRRRATLDADSRAVRNFFLRILAEAGAFERTARPAPKPSKPASGGK
jgi:hypothetical protein